MHWKRYTTNNGEHENTDGFGYVHNCVYVYTCAVFFLGAWVLYTNLGYLRSVYASLRHVEGSLRDAHIKKTPTRARTQDFSPRMEQPNLQLSLRILPTPENQQVPGRRAYATYAALQNTRDQLPQHIVQFPFL